ncbi:LytTR family DNA-binding domain-containing protein [Pedobacter sp. PLR]|uniref:LytR/AlgR family response regulator transcription factor n=1 Tax=Pedobacter sp. PLR TaxID=2994465 RepID=UPI0022458191|nr:LytTR family DNA-binding domain-containing protein [Pedobacter sp. PLR]MCX2451581.1 LytTR family DNA-binding domain-containing protein [Pedobacter sp. PLR]
MYTCIAIDDEFSALELLRDYIAEEPDIKLLKSYTNPLVALSDITKRLKPVDIIFLDIQMPEMNGLELAKLIKHQTKKLVFTTAHANYAINSYELNADDFLLKPISFLKFSQTVKKLFVNPEKLVQKDISEYILVRSAAQRNQFIKIKVADIIAVEAQERSTRITAEKETIFSNSGLSEILALLETTRGFSQIHRSFVIAENRIKILERSHVVLNNNLKIPIGRMFSDFYNKMTKKNYSPL